MVITLLATFAVGAWQQPGISQDPGEVEASVNADGGAMRCEPSIGVRGQNVLVSWNDSYGGSHGSRAGTAAGWSYSTNGGTSYRFGGYLTPGQSSTDGADTRIGVNSDNDFFLLNCQWTPENQALRLYRMRSAKMGVLEELSQPVSGKEIDKPAMSLQGKGTIGLTYTANQRIFFLQSSDAGNSWNKPVELSGADKRTRTGSALQYDGKNIYASWMEGAKFVANELWFARSLDGGRTFEPSRCVYKLKSAPESPDGYTMGGYTQFKYALPCYDTALAVGKSGVSLVAVEGTKNGSMPLLFTSSDKGDSWSSSIPVCGLLPNGHNAFPSVASFRGHLAVLYYHQETADKMADTNAYMTSVGENATFTTKITTVATDWLKVQGDKQHAPIQRTFGDYISLASDTNGDLMAAWTDGRSGQARIMTKRIMSMPIVKRIA